MMTSKFEITIDQYDDMYLYRGGKEIGWASPHNDAGRNALEAIIDMQDKIARLEALNAELLAALKAVESRLTNRFAGVDVDAIVKAAIAKAEGER
jgi:hypothetical protein